MKVVVNNKSKLEVKNIMNLLLNCVKDKTISKIERNQYYAEYLQLSANYLKM